MVYRPVADEVEAGRLRSPDLRRTRYVRQAQTVPLALAIHPLACAASAVPGFRFNWQPRRLPKRARREEEGANACPVRPQRPTDALLIRPPCHRVSTLSSTKERTAVEAIALHILLKADAVEAVVPIATHVH
jgi:hypothetical protein